MIRFSAVAPGPQNLPQPPRMLFAKKTDGMVVGCAAGQIAELGEDIAQVQRRAFVNHESATEWVQTQLTADGVDFEKVEGDSMVSLFSSVQNLRPS
jgi:hypothetical protein